MFYRGLPVDSRRLRTPIVLAAAVALLFAVTACSAAAPTPIYLYTTPTPAPPTPVPTPTPTPTPTPVPTPTRDPNAPTPTPKPTPTPAPTPTVGPAGPAGACSGGADKQAFFASAANGLPFAVYCGVIPSGWYFGSATFTQPNGGQLVVSYKGANNALITIKEGAFCLTSVAACSPHDKLLGTGRLGDLPGNLYTLSGGFAFYVAPGTSVGYTATGTNVSQAVFSTIVAALAKVPKS